MEEAQQQQQEQQYEYQQQQYQYTQNDTTNSTSQSYDSSSSSQIQSYDPYASYAQHYATTQQQQPYQTNLVDYSSSTTTATAYAPSSSSSYYYPDYSTSYQTHNQIGSNSIHPPGVPLPADPHQTHNFYYQTPQSQAYLQPAQPVYGGPQGGRPTRGGARGTFGRYGRGRGGGRGKHAIHQTSAPGAIPSVEAGQAAPSKAPSQMAWCELCRVDCNTFEILEKHKNGKKHIKNLKVFEEMQNLSKQHLTLHNPVISMTHPKPEGSQRSQLLTEHVASGTVPMVNNAEAAQESDMKLPSVGQPSDEAFRRDFSGGRGGLKRKMKAGRGGKWIRAYDGSKRFVEPPKPKQMVPLLCELCNVKCESQVVYESHLAGKKHLTNLKRYQAHKEAFGDAIEALYPTIPNLPPASISQPNQQGRQDAQALASMMLSQQNLRDPQAAQAALVQLLNQHGIHDAQTLIVQLIPHLLTQFQAPGLVPSSVAGVGTDPPSLQSQGQQISTEAAVPVSQNDETKTEQLHVGSFAGSGAAAETSNKPDGGPSEAAAVGAE